MSAIRTSLVAASLLSAFAAQAATTYANVPSASSTTDQVWSIVPFSGGPATDQVTVDMTVQFTGATQGDNFTFWMDDGSSVFPNNTGPHLGLRYAMGPSGATYYVSTGEPDQAFATVPFSSSVELFAYFFKSTGPGGSGNFDRVAFWVNPTSAEKSGYDNPDVVFNVGSSAFSSLSRMGLRTSGLEPGDSVTITNLTVTDAVPEPSGVLMAMAGLGVLGTLTRRRRKA